MKDSIRKNTYWHIFFDDGNVLNNNKLREAQWKQILPQFFIQHFGGTKEIWSDANHRVITELMEILETRWENQDRPDDFNVFWEWWMTRWVDLMFKYAEISPPDTDYVELFKEVSSYVIPKIRSANDGVRETLNILWEGGYNLYTASGEVSWELDEYIWGMGCEKTFRTLYGPDLINEGKLSPVFFEKMFQDVGIDPSRAIVIDDNPYFLEYAREVGANIIQSYINHEKRKVSKYIVRNFRQIPEMIEKIKRDLDK